MVVAGGVKTSENCYTATIDKALMLQGFIHVFVAGGVDIRELLHCYC